MSLSLNYIFLLLLIMILMLICLGIFLISGAYVKLGLSLSTSGFTAYYVYSTGIKYGRYGLEIVIAKNFQHKHIKNDFPVIQNNLLNNRQPLLDNQLKEKK